MSQPHKHSGSPSPNQDDISLFRPEVLSSASQRYGSPVDPLGVGMWLTTGLVLLILAMATTLLAFGSYPRKQTVTGSLIPSDGLLPIVSQRSGIVSEVFKEEGDLVTKGDPIVSISVDSTLNSGQEKGETLQGMLSQLSEVAEEVHMATDASLASQIVSSP